MLDVPLARVRPAGFTYWRPSVDPGIAGPPGQLRGVVYGMQQIAGGVEPFSTLDVSESANGGGSGWQGTMRRVPRRLVSYVPQDPRA